MLPNVNNAKLVQNFACVRFLYSSLNAMLKSMSKDASILTYY